ncbi:ADP-dependent NAD(P)H-hydrate dehydratase [Puia sp. P3]|uniref:ADP-dependent NAD(P)H-hydrate dehydratase n=1 Tax=Puia sp. P3 TaxID=3423952 RepID=UPI003D6716EA
MTPHPKEFERLFGPSPDDFARLDRAREKAKQHRIIIVLKGHHSFIAMPGGKGYFNSTGNAGMAKGGSGDTLTGILTALLSQGYSPVRPPSWAYTSTAWPATARPNAGRRRPCSPPT